MTREELLAEFLKTWPLERIRSMTLEDYTKAGSKETYTFWLESRMEDLGSIWGGSAFKFGIYHRRDQTEKLGGRGLRFGEGYAWQEKHGATPQEAFEVVRASVVRSIERIRNRDLAEIEAIDLPNVLKWKSAFLFQDFQHPLIPMIFTEEAIRWLAARKGLEGRQTLSNCMVQLSREWEPSVSWFDYSMELWSEWTREIPQGLAFADSRSWVEVLQKGMSDGRPGIFWWSKNVSGKQPVLDALRGHLQEHGVFPILACQGKHIQWLLEIEDFSSEEEYPDKDWSSAFWHKPLFSDYRDEDGEGNKRAKLVFLVRSIQRIQDNNLVSDIRWWKQLRAPTQDNLQPFSEWPIRNEEGVETTIQGGLAMNPTNRILYGPPGTGKTYETRKAALELLGEEIPAERKLVIQRYEELLDAGQIRFVTFHPSLTYEDFIEGLRPRLDGAESGNLSYEIRDGIFKVICKDARRNWTASRSKGQERSFLELWTELESELEAGNGPLVIPTPGGRTEFQVYEIDDDVIRFNKTKGSSSRHTMNARTLEALFDGTRDVPGGLTTYYKGLSNFLKERAGKKISTASSELKQFVLIIDEINRGNIPAIFGELITLLEPSKRMGQSEPLEVQLPSSQERFQVPPNLHILGTMNTADRSVEALDVALRRRFEFVEMMPKSDKLKTTADGLDLPAILTTINARLEALLDRDHTIGHAFLIGAQSIDDVKHTFATKIIPLLQEFFYGDWGKIGLVLGSGFVRKSPLGKIAFAKGFDDDLEVVDIFEMIPQDEWSIEALKGILSRA